MKLCALLFTILIPMLPAADLQAIPFQTITGEETSLGEFDGKVVLVVNTASKCGFTPQYEGLEKLQQAYGERGFRVIAFPCNDFGRQEPGTAEEIQEFCRTQFGTSFPLMAKVHVKGKEAHPLFAALTAKGSPVAGSIKWNFTKFLIGRDGTPLARFGSRTKPQDEKLVKAIEEALGD